MDFHISTVYHNGHARVRVLAKCVDLSVSNIYSIGCSVTELRRRYIGAWIAVELGDRPEFIDDVICVTFDEARPRFSVRGSDFNTMNDYGVTGISRCLRALINGCNEYLKYNSDIL